MNHFSCIHNEKNDPIKLRFFLEYATQNTPLSETKGDIPTLLFWFRFTLGFLNNYASQLNIFFIQKVTVVSRCVIKSTKKRGLEGKSGEM